jgi:hypothetical protein
VTNGAWPWLPPRVVFACSRPPVWKLQLPFRPPCILTPILCATAVHVSLPWYRTRRHRGPFEVPPQRPTLTGKICDRYASQLDLSRCKRHPANSNPFEAIPSLGLISSSIRAHVARPVLQLHILRRNELQVMSIRQRVEPQVYYSSTAYLLFELSTLSRPFCVKRKKP